MKKTLYFWLLFILFMMNTKALSAVEYIQKIAERAGGDVNSVEQIGNTGLAYDNTEDKNLRYIGSNPSNYVLFNDESWRIIGVFNNVLDENNNPSSYLKIIRSSSIGSYSWDTSVSSVNYGNGINQWGPSDSYLGADLMLELNGDYLNDGLTENPLWYNGTGDQKTATYNKNLSLLSYYKNQVADVLWYAGGIYSTSLSNPAVNYVNERSSVPNTPSGHYCNGSDCNDTVKRTATWFGKIALPAISDYGFATNGSSTLTRQQCLGLSMNSWQSCSEYNWLKPATGSKERSITPLQSINSNNALWGYNNTKVIPISADEATMTRPVLFLKKDVAIIRGTGTSSNPYIVKLLNNSNITIINDNNFGNFVIDKTNNVEELSDVLFSVIPIEGYRVSNIEIKDASNNNINYSLTNNDNEYHFSMPGSNVTITLEYEKIKSSINVEIVNETEDLNVEINDLTQIEYNEEVNFTIKPIKGFKIKSVVIKDANNNEIEFTKNNNKYTFIMPSSDVTIIPSYERVSNNVSIIDNEGIKEFAIEVNDAEAVLYEEKVKFTIIPEEDYEIEKIDIIDENQNLIDYTKTNKEYEYEFIMPDTSVTITPISRHIIQFIEGMNQVFDVKNDSKMKFKLNMDYTQFINDGKIYVDNVLVDSTHYELSSDNIIIFYDDYTKLLSVGNHVIEAKLSDGRIAQTEFIISSNFIDNPIIKGIVNPKTSDKVIMVIILLIIALLVMTYFKRLNIKRF